MAKVFQSRNKHVSFTKNQIQDKEKELKREYKMLKDARSQSGAGWCAKSCRIQADDDLWNNLVIVSLFDHKLMKDTLLIINRKLYTIMTLISSCHVFC